MKKILSSINVISIISLFFLNVFTVSAQESQIVTSESKLTVEGTSIIHDWTIEAKGMSGKSNYTVDSGLLKEITSLDFSVDVALLESGRSGMDSNIVDALKGKVNTTITFKLTKVVKITKTAENMFSVETQGVLTIKGRTKLINQNFDIELTGNKLTFSGKQKIDMTHYGVEPPKALLGTIKTGKNVTVDFKVAYN
jgi:hypothetical protein